MKLIRFIVIIAAAMMPLTAHALYYSAEKKEDSKITNQEGHNMPSEKIPQRTITENSPITQHSNTTQVEYSTHIKSIPPPQNTDTPETVSTLEDILKQHNSHVSQDNPMVIDRLPGDQEDMMLLTTALPILAVSGAGNSLNWHNDLDSKARAVVEGYLTYFSKKIKSSFAKWLTHGSRYVPVMKQVLQEQNIPGDLVYLSLIESGFNIFARSTSHAVGPWQLMASTAKRLDLKINYWVDERHDPIKSTKAASSYLRFLFDKFGSWDLAIAAYNAGELNIENALRRSNTTSFWKLFSSSHIPNETKQFVPKFLAAREIGQTPEKYGMDDVDVRTPFTFDAVIISPPATLDFIAGAAGTTVEKIRELNPEIRQWCIPPYMQKYRLRIPVGKKDSFLAAYNAASEGERYPLASYITVPGDTLAMIARKARVQLDILRDLNQLSSNGRLTPGTVIYMPPHTTVSQADDNNPKGHAKIRPHVKIKQQAKVHLHVKTTEHKAKAKIHNTTQHKTISNKLVKKHDKPAKTAAHIKASTKNHKRA
ncbi:MAG: transglycosylase SLT domain-containing protein [Nitrospirae bacterium]|nr:transglycosylase SLT domain-containing protein [Nitrospirota bacterium]